MRMNEECDNPIDINYAQGETYVQYFRVDLDSHLKMSSKAHYYTYILKFGDGRIFG